MHDVACDPKRSGSFSCTDRLQRSFHQLLINTSRPFSPKRWNEARFDLTDNQRSAEYGYVKMRCQCRRHD